jgi:hypothetical protein
MTPPGIDPTKAEPVAAIVAPVIGGVPSFCRSEASGAHSGGNPHGSVHAGEQSGSADSVGKKASVRSAPPASATRPQASIGCVFFMRQ